MGFCIDVVDCDNKAYEMRSKLTTRYALRSRRWCQTVRTIVEPQKHIVRIWGTQQVTEGIIFRLMKYVLRVDTDDKVLLHNVITGQMVILDEREVELLNKLPAVYSQEMESLVVAHYLVPEDYCEREYVKKLQLILRKLEGN